MKIDCPGTVSPPKNLKVRPDDKHDQVFVLCLITFTLCLRGLRGPEARQNKLTLTSLYKTSSWPVEFGVCHLCIPPLVENTVTHRTFSTAHQVTICLLCNTSFTNVCFLCAIKGLYIALSQFLSFKVSFDENTPRFVIKVKLPRNIVCSELAQELTHVTPHFFPLLLLWSIMFKQKSHKNHIFKRT